MARESSNTRATTARVLASTTSHKREPLLPTLEVFARLGLKDLDLNLHHFLEQGQSAASVAEAVARHDLVAHMLSGGWCDFFHRPPQIEDTFASVLRQVAIADTLGVRRLRLFFGRLPYAEYSAAACATAADNLKRLSDQHSSMLFVFENHDGASLHPEVCREILERVDCPNIRMNFDPINFERDAVNGLAALEQLGPLIGHVHLKGLARGDFCEFGDGDIDLLPVLRALIGGGYAGGFTVEYEGPFDGTLRLHQSVRRATAVVHALTAEL